MFCFTFTGQYSAQDTQQASNRPQYIQIHQTIQQHIRQYIRHIINCSLLDYNYDWLLWCNNINPADVAPGSKTSWTTSSSAACLRSSCSTIYNVFEQLLSKARWIHVNAGHMFSLQKGSKPGFYSDLETLMFSFTQQAHTSLTFKSSGRYNVFFAYPPSKNIASCSVVLIFRLQRNVARKAKHVVRYGHFFRKPIDTWRKWSNIMLIHLVKFRALPKNI